MSWRSMLFCKHVLLLRKCNFLQHSVPKSWRCLTINTKHFFQSITLSMKLAASAQLFTRISQANSTVTNTVTIPTYTLCIIISCLEYDSFTTWIMRIHYLWNSLNESGSDKLKYPDRSAANTTPCVLFREENSFALNCNKRSKNRETVCKELCANLAETCCVYLATRVQACGPNMPTTIHECHC